MVTPSRVLKAYYATTFLVGLALTVPVAYYVTTDDVGYRGAALVLLSVNVLFVMLLPLVLDWAERRYYKARFLAMEEVAKDNPELALILSSQCEKLALPGLRLAVVDDSVDEMFSYGLWRNNPRLIVSTQVLNAHTQKNLAPSIEAELTRFASQDNTLIFLMFAGFQVMIQNIIVYLLQSHIIHF